MIRNLIISVALAALAAVNAKPEERQQQPRVTGIGGIFFRSSDPAALRDWYSSALGVVTDAYGANFAARDYNENNVPVFTIWSPFKQDTNYFQPSVKEFMINFRVHNLDGLLEKLKHMGIAPLDAVEAYDYGRFVHIMDPDGNKLELWEPNNQDYEKMVGDKLSF